MKRLRVAAAALMPVLLVYMGSGTAEERPTQTFAKEMVGQPAPAVATSIDEARRRVLEAGRRIGGLLKKRPETPHPNAELLELRDSIDREIQGIEGERFPALELLVQTDNDNRLQRTEDKGVYLLGVEDLAGRQRWLSGRLLPMWHVRGLEPVVLTLADTIGARPAAVALPKNAQAEAKLLLSGSSSQAAVHPYPGDIDYAEEIVVRAPSLSAAAGALAEVLVEFVARTADDAHLELDLIRLTPVPAKRRRNTDYHWPVSRLLDPAQRKEFVSQLMSIDGGKANSDWRALLPDGRYIKANKAFGLYGIDSRSGRPFFQPEPLYSKYQHVYLGPQPTPPMRKIPLGEFTQFMQGFIKRHRDQGSYLKVAKRVFIYLRAIGELEGMAAIETVFDSEAARISQQFQGLRAIAMALEPERGSRLLTVDGAKAQTLAAAQVIEADLASIPGATSDHASGATRELQRISQRFTARGGDRPTLLQPDANLAKRLHALLDGEVRTVVERALEDPIKRVIVRYIQ